ncbi:MAG: bifunctional 4-hydroxy-2-oxoglutarate aldolase/2-dehydro-3-deoxy-phosphogluconate aldolase [Candidatus Omnitrophota bacterium]
MDVASFKKLPMMGILRGIKEDILEPLTRAIISSGLRTIEIAMNTEDAPKLIKNMKGLAKGSLIVGAGTVLTKKDLEAALKSGASFIVLPTLIKEVVEECVRENIPVFPGALTPKEIKDAWDSGAAMVKVFPAKFFGPGYFKEIKGPFNDIELLACGGVTPENIKEFFKNGASAIAFGGSIFKKEFLNKDNIHIIEENIRMFIANYGRLNT